MGADEYEVYSSLLNGYFTSLNTRRYLLRQHVSPLCGSEPLAHYLPGLKREAVTDLVAKTLPCIQDEPYHRLKQQFWTPRPVQLVSDEELHAAYHWPLVGGFLIFRKIFHSSEIVGFSRVGFDKEHTQAVLRVDGMGAWWYVLMERRAGLWWVVARDFHGCVIH